MATLTARDRFKQNIEDGGDQVVVEYFKRLNSEEASIDDLRKAVELVAKAHGLQQPDKTDSLMSVSWTITGGNVTIGVSQAPAATDAQDLPLVEDVSDSAPLTPEAALIASEPTFVVPPIENLLEAS